MIKVDPDNQTYFSKVHTCSFHLKHPGKSFPGCTCSGVFGIKEASPKEYKENRIRRLRKVKKNLEEQLAKINAELGEK